MLQTDYYDTSGGLVNRQIAEPTRADADGNVEFAFVVPRVTQEVQWQVSLAFYCRDDAQSDVGTGMREAVYVGILDTVKRKIDCWFGELQAAAAAAPAAQALPRLHALGAAQEAIAQSTGPGRDRLGDGRSTDGDAGGAALRLTPRGHGSGGPAQIIET